MGGRSRADDGTSSPGGAASLKDDARNGCISGIRRGKIAACYTDPEHHRADLLPTGRRIVTIPPLPDSPPLLVGRERELGILRAHLAATRDGRGSLVLIGGEAGIGKTALAETIAREATDQSALALVGRCYDLSETPPYGPWLELFGRYRQDTGLPPAPPAFTQRGTIGQTTSQAALLQEVSDFLVAVAARQSLVLLLDDLQ